MHNRKGKFSAPRSNHPPVARRRRKQGVRVIQVILAVLLSLVCLSALVVIGSILHMKKASSDFEQLASIVQENETKAPTIPTAPAAQTIPTEPQPTQTTAPTEPVILEKYQPLASKNPDMLGWISIEGTNVDYPVMYSPEEPQRYLHSNFDGQYSYGGIPFLDAHCQPDSDNLLIYGHNMLDGSMFRSIMNYQHKSYWEKHPTIHFDTLYEEGEYEVLAAFYDRVYYKSEECFKFYQFIDAQSDEEYRNAISQFQQKAIYDTGITAQPGDQLITLVTCAYHVENGRFVVVARKI